MNATKTFLLAAAVAVGDASAQGKDWKTAKLDDGKLTVRYKVAKIDESPRIDYVASTVDKSSLQSFVSLMKDVSKHKDFNDDESSRTVKVISDSESVVHYAFNVPWPFPKSDLVARFKVSEDPAEKRATFTLAASPDEYKTSAKNRSTHHHTVYEFKEEEDGNVRITITASLSPPFDVPLWMVKSSFPDTPADLIHRISKLASSGPSVSR